MAWPRDTAQIVATLNRALGMADWAVNVETWHATIAPDPANRVADLALADGPTDRKQAISWLCHEIAHAYVSRFLSDLTDQASAIRWDALATDLVKRIGEDAANEAIDAAQLDGDEFDQEDFADALETILATRLRRGMK